MSKLALSVNLDSLTDRPRMACPKAGLPTVLARKERKATKEQLAKDFRDAVWLRDKGRSRATGKKLQRDASDWDVCGKVACVRAPEFKRFDYAGPDDRGLEQTFTWRDSDGTVTKQRIG